MFVQRMGFEEDAVMEERLVLNAEEEEEEAEKQSNSDAGKQELDEAGNVCAAMASIMSGLSVRVHVAGSKLCGYEKKPIHGQVARLRKEDQQLMEDVCTDACACACGMISGNCSSGSGGGIASPCRRRILHQMVASNHDNCRTPPHFDNNTASGGHHGDGDMHHHGNSSSSSGGSGGVASNVSTPRASTPSPLGIRTRSWSTAAADAAWDSAASIARTVSSSF